MNDEGPTLESLTRRLAECPADFLAEPLVEGAGIVNTAAVVSDLLRDLGGHGLTRATAAPFSADRLRAADRNRLRLTLVAAWLLHDQWFRERARFAAEAWALLSGGLTELSSVVDAGRFVSDPDRREELARVCLNAMGLRPAGESVLQAQDRLATLSSVEHLRVMRETRAAQEHARRVREAMRRKAAEEAAAKVSRE